MMRMAARVLGTAMVALPLAWAGVARADDANSSNPSEASRTPSATFSPTYQQYQAPPVQVPSGSIIGYKPITNSQLEAAMSGAVPAPSAAVQAYPGAVRVTMAAPGVAVGAGAGQMGQGQMPVGYLTGVVGEGFYTLGRDDVIQIDVRNQPEFSGAFVIGFDGRIQYNYLGDIPIAGMTKYEVQQVLEKMLQKYIRLPMVNVMIIAYNSKVVYVIGEVNNPGKFIMRGDAIKLREAILAAGLPTSTAALGRVHVIKPDLENPEIRVLNVKKILYAGKLKDDIDVHTGEVIVVPSTAWSKVNDFLSGLFSPITRVARMAALAAL
jgi:polysaccharide export outer membrane protein